MPVASDRVSILDVGHGNCGVIVADGEVTVVDAPRGAPLFRHLDRHGINVVTNLLVSHGDRDHLAGAAALLSSRRHTVRHVYANPDPNRRTDIWRQFLQAVRIAGPETTCFNSLSSTMPGRIKTEGFTLEILSPTPYFAMRGSAPGGLPANSVSAVVRVVRDGEGIVLLAADMDAETMAELEVQGRMPDLTARVLVFPHHGGFPGRANPRTFAERLCTLVDPERVVFSIGRGNQNPQPEIVAGVRAGAPNAHISCTQLSVHCREDPLHPVEGNHCAGDVEIVFSGGVILPSRETHLAIIQARARTPICRN